MSTAALNNLWTYIESMGLSSKNRRWLADKLLECNTSTHKMHTSTTHGAITDEILDARLFGSVALPADFDYKQEIGSVLTEKYGL